MELVWSNLPHLYQKQSVVNMVLLGAVCKTGLINKDDLKAAIKLLVKPDFFELNWYRESRYWMHVSDMKTAEQHAIENGMAKGIQQGIEKGTIQQIKTI